MQLDSLYVNITFGRSIMATNPLRLLLIVAVLAGGIPVQAQNTPPPIDPAISSLAGRIADSLQRAHAKGVVVADLQGPERQKYPLGKYLADQLSFSLEKDFPKLKVIDRPSQGGPSLGARSGDEGEALEETKSWARKLHANVVITGSYAKAPQGIGVSLLASFCDDSRRWIGLTNGLIPITEAVTSLSPDPVPSSKSGIATAGREGTTVPACIYCPDPPLPVCEARDVKCPGTVVLKVVVNDQGQIEKIAVVKSSGLGLDQKAIEAVKKWKLKPAIGPDGKPVTVYMPIEMTFRLF